MLRIWLLLAFKLHGVATSRQIIGPNDAFLSRTLHSDPLQDEAYFSPWSENMRYLSANWQVSRRTPLSNFIVRHVSPESLVHSVVPCPHLRCKALQTNKQPGNSQTPSRRQKPLLFRQGLTVPPSFLHPACNPQAPFCAGVNYASNVVGNNELARKTDGSNYISFAALTINVINPPESLFDPQLHVNSRQGFIESDLPVGAALRTGQASHTAPVKVIVTDQDLKPGMPPATYQYILSGSAAAYFDINQKGEVVLNSKDIRQAKQAQLNLTVQKIDETAIISYVELQVMAKETDTTPVRTSRPESLSINVLKAVDHSLEFSSPTYNIIAQPFVPQQQLIQVLNTQDY
ncbi:unnamed protein product [Soboliphyme baturini]|uniref:Cadherin domain-containing protein n=1 Tax=Soboliphyme baturini TaxID=241478 RepID=A0A183IWU2_9BILA|nr:unnamed protein product [Soboliphyme baturini]